MRVAAVLRTTVVFAVVLVSFYTVAQARTPRAAVLAVFVMYVVAATAWVRAQYAQSRDCVTPTAIRPLIIVWAALIVAAAGTAVARVVGADAGGLGGFGVLALLGAYLTAGYLILRGRHFIATNADLASHAAASAIGWSDQPTPRGLWRNCRAQIRRSPRILAGLLAGLVGALYGCLLLPSALESWTWVMRVLTAAALVAAFIPWLVSLLSEHAIMWFAGRGGPQRVIAVLVGFAVFAALIRWVWVEEGWLIGASVVALAAFLAVAWASSTLVDIAVVVAVIALMGVTPQQDPADRPLSAAAEQTTSSMTVSRAANADSLTGCPDRRSASDEAAMVRRQCLLVVLGDSYMSGEGAATYIEGTDEGGGNTCRRATTAWSQLAGRQPPFTRLVSFACSGADSYNIRSTESPIEPAPLAPTPAPQGGVDRTQLDEYLIDYKAPSVEAGTWEEPALVVLSVGGNDAGFSAIGATCLAAGDCNDDTPASLFLGRNLTRLENRLRQVYTHVDYIFPRTPVAVALYPDPAHDNAPCDDVILTKGDVDFVDGFLRKLNRVITDTADDYGFYVIDDFTDALERRNLQLCDEVNGGRAGLNFIGLRSVGGLSEQRFSPGSWYHNSLHPNERGHSALHEAFQRWLNRPRDPADGQEVEFGESGVVGLAGLATRTPNPFTAPADRPKPVGEVYTEDADECSSWAPGDDHECVKRSSTWAAQQTAQYVAWRAVPTAAGAAAGAWLVAVAAMGWRRSRIMQAADADRGED